LGGGLGQAVDRALVLLVFRTGLQILSEGSQGMGEADRL